MKMPISLQSTSTLIQKGFTKTMNFPWFKNTLSNQLDSIIIVSGIPRSGTSMMMQLLDAAGIPVLTDEVRVADENNKKGYYELESVKKLAAGNHSCIENSRGKVIKVVSSLLKYLPPDQNYKIVFMRRDLESILSSQGKMLVNSGQKYDAHQDSELKLLFKKHLDDIQSWFRVQKNIEVVEIDYDDAINAPESCFFALEKFLAPIEINREAMLMSIDKRLNHHQKL